MASFMHIIYPEKAWVNRLKESLNIVFRFLDILTLFSGVQEQSAAFDCDLPRLALTILI